MVAGVLMSIKVEPKAKAPAGHRPEEDRKADYIKRGENMLIEVVQSAVFGALTTGRIKPHEVVVIEGDHIGTLAGKLSDLRYLVERELIEDEPTSDEEESEDAPEDVPGTDPQIVEEAVEEEAEDVSVEVVETPQEPKVESVTKVPYKKPEVYKYDTLKDARNPDGTPVLEVHKAYSLIRSGGMTAREVADRYSIRDARSVAQAARQYGARFHREPKEPYKVDVQGLSKAREDKDEDS
jgi:hypothetical protein